jgi:hypothetical protein
MSDDGTPTRETDVALTRAEAEAVRDIFADMSIAPLGRNYFERYREIRDALGELVEVADGDVSPELLRSHLDDDDVDYVTSIVEHLRNFAEEGIRRRGEVEPYVSTRDDIQRLEPYLELIEPHFG